MKQIWSKNCNLYIHYILKGIVRNLIKMSQPYSNLHQFVHQVDTKTFTKIIDVNDVMAKDINYLQHSIKNTVKIAQYKLSAYYLMYNSFKIGTLYRKFKPKFILPFRNFESIFQFLEQKPYCFILRCMSCAYLIQIKL